MKYLLPCSCGKSVPVEASQAGQRVRCSCGQMLDVPTMRLVRQLPPATRPAPGTRRPTRSWPLAQRLLFACGLAMFFGGGMAVAYYQWIRSQLQTEEVAWDDLEGAMAAIAELNIEEAWEFWTIHRDLEIGPYSPPPFVIHRLADVTLTRYVTLGAAVAAGGLLLMLLGVVLRPAAARARPRPAAGT